MKIRQKISLLLAVFAVVATPNTTIYVALAQQAQQPQTGRPNLAQFAQYQNVFELVSLIPMLIEMDKQRPLAFTRAQAQKLIPILKNLQTRSDLKPKDAEAIMVMIEDKILTDKQLAWLDDQRLKLEEERRARAEQRRRSGQTGPSGNAPMRGPAAEGQDANFFRDLIAGRPVNPFKATRAAQQVQQLINLLTKR